MRQKTWKSLSVSPLPNETTCLAWSMSARLICQCWQISYNLTHWLHFITIKTRTQEQTNARHTDDCPELTLLRLCIKYNLRNDLSTASHQSRTGLTPSVVVVATVHRRLDLDGFGYPKAAGISSPWNYYNKLTYPVDLMDVNEHLYISMASLLYV